MKMLITEDTFVPNTHEPGEGPTLATRFSLLDTDKDTARKLVDAGRALYTEKRDDPYRGDRVASDAMLDVAARALKDAAIKAKAEVKAEG